MAVSKSKGSLLVSFLQGDLNAIPLKFRSAIKLTRTTQPVNLAETHSPIGVNGLLSSNLVQTRTNERDEELIYGDISNATFDGQEFMSDDGQIANVTETILEKDDPDATLTADEKTAGGELIDLGNGYVIKRTVERPALFAKKFFERARQIRIPPKFQTRIDTVTTAETVAGTASMPASLGASDLLKREEQLDVHTKRVTATTYGIGSSPVTLTTDQNYVDRTYGEVVETLSSTAQTVDSGVMVHSSEVETFEDGSSLKTTIRAKGSSHPVLSGQRYDNELGLPLPFTEQYLGTSTPVSSGVEVEIVNRDKYLHRKFTPTSAIDTAIVRYPKRVSLPDIPDELISLKVEWTKDKAEGSYATDWAGASGTGSGARAYSLSGNESANAQSSGSLIPTLVPEFRQYRNRNLPGELVVFYMPKSAMTLADINNRLGTVGFWPVFKPVAHAITLKGGKVSVQAQATGSAHASADLDKPTDSWDRTEGEGTSFDLSPYQKTEIIGPFIHGEIEIEGDTEDSITVTAEAAVGWTGSNFPAVDVESIASKTLNGSVTPTTLDATTPAAVPKTGLYIVDVTPMSSQVPDYVKIAVELFDASVLA